MSMAWGGLSTNYRATIIAHELSIPSHGPVAMAPDRILSQPRPIPFEGNVHEGEPELGRQPLGQGVQTRRTVDLQAGGDYRARGNYLLNAGPSPQRTFRRGLVDRLRVMGQWLAVTGLDRAVAV